MNYYDYMLHMLRKEREQMSILLKTRMQTQTELALPPTESDLPLWTSCSNCDKVVHQHDAVIKQYCQGRRTLVEHFCSNGCHHSWYVNRLRSFGL